MKRYHILFEGHVQGVGFRVSVRQIAHEFHVAGQVRNLSDGRVELIVEGSADQLQALLLAILHKLGDHVHHHTLEKLPATGEFGDAEQGKVVVTY
jgi:acylphosphatase